MKKAIAIVIMMMLIPFLSKAQWAKAGRVDLEIGGGYSFAASVNADAIDYNGGFYLEWRKYLKQMPIDLGVHLGLSQMHKTLGIVNYKYQSFGVLAVGDYSFRHGKLINPYIGTGIGMSFNNDAGGVFNEGFMTNFCFMPRIGVRFLNHINLSVDYMFTQKDYSHANIRFGYYF